MNTVIAILGWLVFEVNATYNTLKTIGRIDMIHHGVKYITINEDITKGLVKSPEGYLELQLGRHRLASWLSRSKYYMTRRLLAVAQSEDSQLRMVALRKLTSINRLTQSDLIQLAQTCDSHTAVGLARSPNISLGYFLPPPKLYKIPGKEIAALEGDLWEGRNSPVWSPMYILHNNPVAANLCTQRISNEYGLVNKMRDVLYELNQRHSHLCVKYFLSKAFPEYEKQNNYLLDAEVMLTEPWQILTTQENLLPLCIQALDHHISIVHSEVVISDLVKFNGLPLLMAVYQQHKEDMNVTKMICRILTRVCAHPEYLPKIYESGWVGVLAEWVSSDDFLLSVLAGQCLINLDRDDPTCSNYGRNVVPLHPVHRSHPPLLDVVFVHGLLGGVLTTWRQRDRRDSVTMMLQKDDLSVDTQRHSSDRNTEEYLAALTEQTLAEWDQLGSDYEFVVSDFPVNCKSKDSHNLLTLSGKDPQVRQCGTESLSSVCWPKDWLPKDCSSIRLLGVDYESRISEWFPTCSEKLRAKTLKERATVVLSELKSCGIGRRPTVWVAHSMGGLLVKKMLTEALHSGDLSIRSIAYNSKAIVFLSTPHLGCPLAKMNDILNYLLWPSTEVEELRHNSEVLNHLHQEFHGLLRDVNIRIVTFAEAKTTRVSTLGVDFHIVPPEFSYFDVGDLYEMPCDHACVAKPYNRAFRSPFLI